MLWLWFFFVVVFLLSFAILFAFCNIENIKAEKFQQQNDDDVFCFVLIEFSILRPSKKKWKIVKEIK